MSRKHNAIYKLTVVISKTNRKDETHILTFLDEDTMRSAQYELSKHPSVKSVEREPHGYAVTRTVAEAITHINLMTL